MPELPHTVAALRAQQLARFNILDTPREAAFDEIAAKAARACGTPLGLVSLADTHRLWFKAGVGIRAAQIPREGSCCTVCIETPGVPMLIEDASQDPRFSSHALVVKAPYMRFYAGAPLVAQNGVAVGTLCVLDYMPRQLSAAQIATLTQLAAQVVGLLELRAQAAQ